MTESTNECPSECMYGECTICLFQYYDEDKKVTECNHTFHQECIDRWLETNNSCPLCRTVLYNEQQPGFGSIVSVTLHRLGDLIQIPIIVPPLNPSSQIDGRAIQHSSHEEASSQLELDIASVRRGSIIPIGYGGLLQLVAWGARDIAMTENAPITIYKNPITIYKNPSYQTQKQSRRNQIKYNNRQNVKHQNRRH